MRMWLGLEIVVAGLPPLGIYSNLVREIQIDVQN